MFICIQKINFISNLYFEILQRHYKLTFLGTWECLTIPIKTIASICSILSCLSASKKSTSSHLFISYNIEEKQQICYFGQFVHGWQNTPKMTVLLWRFLNLEIYQQPKINFILYIFFAILQRYCKLVVLGILGMFD